MALGTSPQWGIPSSAMEDAGHSDSAALSHLLARPWLAKGAAAEQSVEAEGEEPQISAEERWKKAMAADPTNLDAYFRLADIYIHEGRLDEAAKSLEQAHQVSGGGNLHVRERIEDLQLKQAARQVAVAQKNFDHEQSPESKKILDRAKTQANSSLTEAAMCGAIRRVL